jgi:histidinol-phosphatase (PHP family)
MELRDYHVHLEEGPFTIEWIEKFLEVGKRKGIVEIGFSEHSHRFKEAAELIASKGFRGKWTSGEATESIEDYIKLVEKAKDMGLPVKLGIEMDYIPEYEKEIGEFIRQYPFDYVLGLFIGWGILVLTIQT